MSPPGGESWLVTGASGFLGRHLVELLERTPAVQYSLALVRSREAWEAMAWTHPLRRVRPLVGDITETGWWESLPGGSAGERLGGIFHLAALVSHQRRDAERVRHVNVEGTLNIVRLAASRRCRLVFVSTSGTVGCFRKADASADEDAPFCEAEVRQWPYYRSKVEAEREARRLATQLGVELVILRPPVLLGPGDHRRRSSAHVLRLLEGKVPFLIEGGMHFADVRDVAPALLCAMEQPHPRPVYHLPGTQYTIPEFYATVAELAGRPPPRRIVPYRVARLLAGVADRLGLPLLPKPELVEMASHYWGLTSQHAGPDLGYQGRPGRATLQDTIAWLREHPS